MLVVGWIILIIGLIGSFTSFTANPEDSAVRQAVVLLYAVFWMLFAILGQLIINANSESAQARRLPKSESHKFAGAEQTEINKT